MISDDSDEDISDDKDNDWSELSEIIDKAIGDVQEYNFKDNLTLVLNRHSMDELSPLLNKLNQNIINLLSSGKDVNITLRLKDK
jgi:hypothetical protein